MGSKLCENKEKKRYDYVAGLLTGGFRAKNLTTKEFKKWDSRADSYRANQPSGKDQVERFIQLDGFGGNKDHV